MSNAATQFLAQGTPRDQAPRNDAERGGRVPGPERGQEAVLAPNSLAAVGAGYVVCGRRFTRSESSAGRRTSSSRARFGCYLREVADLLRA